MIVQVITVRLIQTQNHGNLRSADGAPTVGGEIWCSFLSTHAFLLGNGQTYATRGAPYYRVSRIFMSRIFSVPPSVCLSYLGQLDAGQRRGWPPELCGLRIRPRTDVDPPRSAGAYMYIVSPRDNLSYFS